MNSISVLRARYFAIACRFCQSTIEHLIVNAIELGWTESSMQQLENGLSKVEAFGCNCEDIQIDV